MLQKLKDDALQARKARDTVRATLLTTVLSDVNVRAKNDGNRLATDADVQKVIERFHKQLALAISARADEQLIQEQKILSEYATVEQTQEIDYDTLVAKLIADNADKWEAVKTNPKNLGWFQGQAMKETKGKANPGTLQKLFAEALAQ
jgi:Asp-tRNA(Asn)/Glu-tRNA(Gln) amidotransferase B subunit